MQHETLYGYTKTMMEDDHSVEGKLTNAKHSTVSSSLKNARKPILLSASEKKSPPEFHRY